MCSAPRVISCLKPKKREQAACDSTWVPFLTLPSEGDSADLCRGLGGQEPSDAAGARQLVTCPGRAHSCFICHSC